MVLYSWICQTLMTNESGHVSSFQVPIGLQVKLWYQTHDTVPRRSLYDMAARVCFACYDINRFAFGHPGTQSRQISQKILTLAFAKLKIDDGMDINMKMVSLLSNADPVASHQRCSSFSIPDQSIRS
jgi:hypothetical protein